MKTTAKTAEMRKDIENLITVNLTGSEKQISYAKTILIDAASDVVNSKIAATARGEEIDIVVDDKIITALNMHADSSFIINNKSQYDWKNNKSISSLITVQ